MSDIPHECVIGGTPARVIKTGIRRIDNHKLERQLSSFFAEHENVKKFNFDKKINHDICDADY